MAQGADSNQRKKNRNWEKEVLPYVRKELKEFYKEGINPTLRTIFYRLASNNIIRNVQNDYTYLSEYTAKCRKRDVIISRLNIAGAIKHGLLNEYIDILKSYGLVIQYNKSRHGSHNDTIYDEFDEKKYILKLDAILPINCFADETRGVTSVADEYKTPQELIKEKLDFLRYLPEKYNKLIPKWHNQPYHIELWTEKNAMVGTLRSILKDLDVRIVYNRGFDSVTNTERTYQRIKKAWGKEKGKEKKVRILYCGDLDPSGDAMDDIIKENLGVHFNVESMKKEGLYNFKRVGVLYEHIEEFHLLKNPDKDVLAKLKQDPRKDKFMEKYHLESEDDLFQIEIDALAAANPAAFKKMILDEIEPLFDKEIYFRILSDPNHSEEHISLHIRKIVQKFIEELSIKSFMQSTF